MRTKSAFTFAIIATVVVGSSNFAWAAASSMDTEPTTQQEIKELRETVQKLEDEIAKLQAQIDAERDVLSVSQSLHERAHDNLVEAHESQLSSIEATYNTAVNQIENVSNWFMGLFTVLGLVTFFLGVPALKRYLEERLLESLSPHAEKVVQQQLPVWDNQVREAIVKYESLFAEKYKQYAKLGG